MSSSNLRELPARLDFRHDRVSLLLHTDDLAVDAHIDAFFLEEAGNSLRDVVVLPRDQTRSEFDDGHLASKTAISLSKFKADVTAAHDHEM